MTSPQAGVPTPVRMWRMRRNTLRRDSDVREGWIVMVTWVLAIAAGILAGAAAAHVVDARLAARAAQVHAVPAVLSDDAPLVAVGGGERVWAPVRWTDAGGAAHTGRARVLAGASEGTRITVWTERADRVVSAPTTGAKATVDASLTGAVVAPSVSVTIWAAGWLIRRCLLRRRLEEWGEEWKQVGPQWRNLSGGRG